MTVKRLFILEVCSLFAVLVLSGCYGPVDYPVVVDVPVVQHSIAGESVENRAIECIVVGEGPDVAFVLAAIHGDEPAGTPLVWELAVHLQQHPHLLEGRKVVLLPVANPDGMVHNSRLNARGVDLNRNFATANRRNSARHGYTALSEPETRAIERLIRQHAPDRVDTIHQWANGCIDHDGPAKALAERMAEYCDLRVQKLGARPGSLGSYAGVDLEIPIISLELPRHAEWLSSELLWERYGATLVAAIVYSDTAK
jgi:protein MpaA